MLKDEAIQAKNCAGQTCYSYSLERLEICINPFEESNADFIQLTLSENVLESYLVVIISCLMVALLFIIFSNGIIVFEGTKFIRHGKLLSIFIAGITFSGLFVSFLRSNFTAKTFCLMNPTEVMGYFYIFFRKSFNLQDNMVKI